MSMSDIAREMSAGGEVSEQKVVSALAEIPTQHPVFLPPGFHDHGDPNALSALLRSKCLGHYPPGDQSPAAATVAQDPQFKGVEPRHLIRLHVILTADTAGTGSADPAVMPDVVKEAVRYVNEVFAASGLRFIFDKDTSFEFRANDLLNRDLPFKTGTIYGSDPASPPFSAGELEAYGARYAAARSKLALARPRRLTVFCSDGTNIVFREDVERWEVVDYWGGFSSHEMGFVRTWSSPTSLGDAEAMRTLGYHWAHEIGHYLHLPHTFVELQWDNKSGTPAEQFARVKSAAAKLIRRYVVSSGAEDRGLAALDGDNHPPAGWGSPPIWDIADTPADVGPDILALANAAAGHGKDACGPVGTVPLTVMLPGEHEPGDPLPPDRKKVYHLAPSRSNIMSYFGSTCGPMSLSGRQIERVNEAVASRNRGDLARFKHVLFHTVRNLDGSWASFGDVQVQTTKKGGSIGRVLLTAASCDSQGNLHVLAVNSRYVLFHATRRSDGSWTGFGDVQEQTAKKGGSIGSVAYVSAYCDQGNNLHLLAVNGVGSLYHAIRQPNGSWGSFGDVQEQTKKAGGHIGMIRCVAGLADRAGKLHVLAVNGAGQLFHSIRKADGSWTSFGDVQQQTRKSGGDIGLVRAVAGAVDRGGVLHVLTLNNASVLFHSIRKADGSWGAFGDVQQQTQKVGSSIGSIAATASAVDERGSLHVLSVNTSDVLHHTARRPDGVWGAFNDVQEVTKKNGYIGPTPRVACSTDSLGALHVLAVN